MHEACEPVWVICGEEDPVKSGQEGWERAVEERGEQEQTIKPGVVVHTFNPSTWEAEAG